MSNFLTVLRWFASRFLSKSEPPTVVVNVALPQSHSEVWDKTFIYRQQQRRRKQRLALRVQIEKGIM